MPPARKPSRAAAAAAPSYPDIPIELPPKSDAERARAASIYRALERRYPDAHCELNYASPHELLIATILSAQATDVAVNKATPALFKAFPTPADYARATPERIEPYVRSLGFFRNKARAVHESMRAVVESFDGQVPRTMDELLSLRGVARKTANVVLGNAFGINVGVTVDTHVIRLSRLYNLAPAGANPEQIERHLMSLFPRDAWCMLSHLLIFHGRRGSTARTKPQDDPIFVEFCDPADAPAPRKATKSATRKPAKKVARTPAASPGAKGKKRAKKPAARRRSAR